MLREVMERLAKQLDVQLLPPQRMKPPDYASLDDTTKRLEAAVTANTPLLVKLVTEVENKRSERETEEERLAQLQQEAKKIEQKREMYQKKRKMNPETDPFGVREYAHPLLAPDSALLSASVPLTEVAIDPELLIEVLDNENEEEKEKENEDRPTEIDVVQGIVNDLAVMAGNRAHLVPLLEDLTTTRDRLCGMLSRAATGVEPLHFTSTSASSSSSSS